MEYKFCIVDISIIFVESSYGLGKCTEYQIAAQMCNTKQADRNPLMKRDNSTPTHTPKHIHTIYTTNFTYVFDISWGQCKKRKMVLNLCHRQGVHLDTHDRWKCVHDVFSMRSFHCGYNATVFNKLLLYALPCIRYTVNFYLYRVFSFILCQLEIIILQTKCNGLSENEWQVFVFLPLPERWNTHI